MTRVSIIMPAYNAARYLAQAIQSVLDQTFKNWELLVVNDGSTDETATIALAYASSDSRIKVLNQHNQGQGSARNAGISAATGEWVAFLDADDLWLPQKLEVQWSFLEKAKNVDVAFCAGWQFEGTNREKTVLYDIHAGYFEPEAMYKLEYTGNFVPILSVLLSREIIERTGLQDECAAMRGCEDWDYWIRLAARGARFYGMPERLFLYRRHDTNTSGDQSRMLMAQLSVFVKNYEPHRFSIAEKRRAFVPLLNSLFIVLVSSGRKAEARDAIRSVSNIFPALAAWYLFLLRFSGSKTVGGFKLAHKIYLKAEKLLTGERKGD
ncbi:glycosyltransferase family 2 protein [Hufsiella ginkgonis]|uniref:Glycosyltransferase n=1 Tax=Hufsiella ginkgonis TaxID=2695274 RepID=A0A7K1Y3L1_9SPHI|nr:glycosyltransferase family A protein [Hufsiella ginkgonis]MXV17457.1 glycosyltransferase [Hufsiella ginkgonis]